MSSSSVVAVPLASGVVFTPAADLGPNSGTGGPVLRGWSLRSTDGIATVTVNIRKGTTVGGAIIATVVAAANTFFFPVEGPRADGGLYCEVVAGTLNAASVLYYS